MSGSPRLVFPRKKKFEILSNFHTYSNYLSFVSFFLEKEKILNCCSIRKLVLNVYFLEKKKFEILLSNLQNCFDCFVFLYFYFFF